MSQLMFISASLANSTAFTMMKHPMSMGLVLLSQTLLICMITSSASHTPWFSYILFLVFLGGMLVLFIYMTSVASNELFQKSSYTNTGVMITVVMVMMMTTIMVEPSLLFNNTNETLMSSGPHTTNMAMSLFNYPNNIMTILAVLYLFLTLIVVVKITESYQGPLRSKN